MQIMESLGGDQAWFDRFLAEHAAVLYYWVCIGFYLVSPKNAYNFMQRVEHHAADTYCGWCRLRWIGCLACAAGARDALCMARHPGAHLAAPFLFCCPFMASLVGSTPGA